VPQVRPINIDEPRSREQLVRQRWLDKPAENSVGDSGLAWFGHLGPERIGGAPKRDRPTIRRESWTGDVAKAAIGQSPVAARRDVPNPQVSVSRGAKPDPGKRPSVRRHRWPETIVDDEFALAGFGTALLDTSRESYSVSPSPEKIGWLRMMPGASGRAKTLTLPLRSTSQISDVKPASWAVWLTPGDEGRIAVIATRSPDDDQAGS
jgi:hypothetical protein